MKKDPPLSTSTIEKNAYFLHQIVEIQSCLANADFNLEAFMQLTAEQMHKLTPATGTVVELVDMDEMVYRAATGTVAAHVGLRLKIENSISGLCVSSNKVLYSDDTEKDPRVNLEACRKVSARSLVVAPLIHQGKTVGVLKILSREVNGFDETDVQTLQLMAGFIAAGIAHQQFYETNQQLLKERTHALDQLQRAQDKLQYLAHFDFLTDLPNRSFFSEKLNAAISKSKRMKTLMALMFLDIDHFKHINDNLGHDIGDELLKAFAARLKQSIRGYDVVARIGGDEFVVLLEELESQDDAVVIAKKIIKNMNEKFKFKNNILDITTSIGICFYRGENLDAMELLKNADQALYIAKNAGRNQYHIHP